MNYSTTDDISSGLHVTSQSADISPLTFGMVARRGMVAGVAGGLANALVLVTLGESRIYDAIAVEAAHSGLNGHPEMFSRGTQVLGGAGAGIITGLVVGFIFALLFAFVRHRLYWPTDAHRALALAAMGFVVHGLIPAIVYPAAPPGIGDPATVTQRTVSYLMLLVATTIAVILATAITRTVALRTGTASNGWLAGSFSFLVVVVLSASMLPSADKVPKDFPAQLLWDFRMVSLGGLASLWAALGIVMALLLSRRSTTA